MTPTVDIHGASDLLKVHPKTVLELIGDGAIPAARIGRAYVMLTGDVLKYLEKKIRVQTTERMCRPL